MAPRLTTGPEHFPRSGLHANGPDMDRAHPNDPLHGMTLEAVLTRLVAQVGWKEMAVAVPIRCFENGPSIKSSLAFLRKTPWARKQVEALFIERCLVPAPPPPGEAK